MVNRDPVSASVYQYLSMSRIEYDYESLLSVLYRTDQSICTVISPVLILSRYSVAYNKNYSRTILQGYYTNRWAERTERIELN